MVITMALGHKTGSWKGFCHGCIMPVGHKTTRIYSQEGQHPFCGVLGNTFELNVCYSIYLLDGATPVFRSVGNTFCFSVLHERLQQFVMTFSLSLAGLFSNQDFLNFVYSVHRFLLWSACRNLADRRVDMDVTNTM